jgi:hypothetical protein
VVSWESTVLDIRLPVKSIDTSGSSTTARTPLTLPCGSARKRVHLVGRWWSSHDAGEVHQRDVGGRDPERHPSIFPFELGNHQGGAFAARWWWDDRHGAAAGPPEVLVRQVQDVLVVGVRHAPWS